MQALDYVSQGVDGDSERGLYVKQSWVPAPPDERITVRNEGTRTAVRLQPFSHRGIGVALTVQIIDTCHSRFADPPMILCTPGRSFIERGKRPEEMQNSKAE